jgi:succinate dehydrogenase hydrophobic anchor subunit
MKGLLKWPLIVAAIVVVARVVIERLNGPHWLSAAVSAVALTVLIGPVYFAMKIAGNKLPRPYSAHFKATALYAVLVRAMLLPVYWLAFFHSWQDQRFVLPVDPSPFVGYVAAPLLTAAFWILASVIVGGGIGALIIALRRPSN